MAHPARVKQRQNTAKQVARHRAHDIDARALHTVDYPPVNTHLVFSLMAL